MAEREGQGAAPVESEAKEEPAAAPDGMMGSLVQRFGEAGARRMLKRRLAQRARSGGEAVPVEMQAGIDRLSGVPMDDVAVHRDSSEPAKLDAKAFAKGNQIHLGPGQEKHLAHEAWHVAQQKQGLAPATGEMGGAAINADPALEDDAHHQGAALAAGGETAHAPSTANATGDVIQMIRVDEEDIGDEFDVRTNDGEECTGTLKSINGGGWYTFTVDGVDRAVRGQDNILRRAALADDSEGGGGSDGDHSHGGFSDGEDSIGECSDLDDDISEVDITNFARDNGVDRKTALARLRESFRRNPRTIRVHTGFGMKTISKGGPAFEDPDETTKGPQAMVGYRQGDYDKHKRVGKDYDEWAGILSDDEEDEATKRERAGMVSGALDGNDDMDLGELTPRQQAAIGGMMLVTHVSDPLRTDADSERVPHNFREILRQRESGDTSLSDAIGDKSKSSFLPARSGGAGQERERLRAEDEVRAQILIRINNCLIHAIAAAAGVQLTLAQLVTIRMRLGSIGDMLVANADTVETILEVLGLQGRGVWIRYRLHDGTPNELLGDEDDGDPLDVFHTGADHFTANCPNVHNYDMGDNG